MKALKVLGLVLLLASPLLSQPPGPPISPGSSGGSGTVSNSDVSCADTQIIRADGASSTATQCSALTVADTTGNLTGPAGGFSIIGGTGATDNLTLDGSAGTAGSVKVTEVGSIELYGMVTSGITGSLNDPSGFYVDDTLGGSYQAALTRDTRGQGLLFLGPVGRIGPASSAGVALRSATTAQRMEVYGTADGVSDSYTNFERLSLSCDGTADCTIATETAGTGADDVVLTVKGEGPAGTLVLDGSDDVAGSVTVTAAGAMIHPVGAVATPAILSTDADSGIWFDSGTDVRVGKNGAAVFGTYNTNLFVQNQIDLGAYGDTGIARATANTARITSTGTTIGKLLYAKAVVPDIDGETTTAAQSGTVWTNTGDGDGEAITLLNDPTIGVQYCFAVDVAQTITVAPSTGESLYYGTDQCGVSLTSNSIGSTLCVTAITGGSGAKWFTMSDKGSWTCND